MRTECFKSSNNISIYDYNTGNVDCPPRCAVCACVYERVQCMDEYDRVYVCVFRDRRIAGQNTIFLGDKLKSRGQYMENICNQINHQTMTLTTKTTTTKLLYIDRSRVRFVNHLRKRWRTKFTIINHWSKK